MRARIIVPVLLAMLALSCSQRPRDAIIGTWQQVPGPESVLTPIVSVAGPGVMSYDFRPDGTLITQGGISAGAEATDGKVETQGGAQPVTHTYSFLDDDTLKISFAPGVRFQGKEARFKVSAARNRMVLMEISQSGLQLGSPDGTLILRRMEARQE